MNGDVADLPEGEFDLAVSLFNVVNYIEHFEDLLAFFKGVHQRLTSAGMYFLDCINGVAAMVDQGNWAARVQLYAQLRRMGVVAALQRAQIRSGDVFRLGRQDWEWE